jgi:hypothetical protein
MGQPWWEGTRDKVLWDYLELLIVPAALALGVYYLNRRQDKRDRKAEEDRRRGERSVENERAQDAAVQAYLDQLSTLLIDKALHDAQQGDNLSTVARARTLTLLPRLNSERKRSVLQFLYDSRLISKDRGVVGLSGADLSEASLYGTNLTGAYLNEAHLSNANLSETVLTGAKLARADISYAHGISNEELDQQAETLSDATMPNGQKYEDWLKDKEDRLV